MSGDSGRSTTQFGDCAPLKTFSKLEHDHRRLVNDLEKCLHGLSGVDVT